MNNKFIVIKLTDDWYKNESIISSLKCSLEIWGGEVLEDAIQSIYTVQRLQNDFLNLVGHPDDLHNKIEERLAMDIGALLMENKLITYCEKNSGPYTDFSGAINIVNLKRGVTDAGK